MSKWISVKDALPDRPGKILVYIEGNIFQGVAFARNSHSLGINLENEISFEFDSLNSYPILTDGDDWVISINGSGWIKPVHFKDPTHWMYIPEIMDKANHE